MTRATPAQRRPRLLAAVALLSLPVLGLVLLTRAPSVDTAATTVHPPAAGRPPQVAPLSPPTAAGRVLRSDGPAIAPTVDTAPPHEGTEPMFARWLAEIGALEPGALERELGGVTHREVAGSERAETLRALRALHHERVTGLLAAEPPPADLPAALSLTEDDLVGAYLRALVAETRPRLRALLVARASFVIRDARAPAALRSVLDTVLREDDELTGQHLVQPLVTSFAHHGGDPRAIWEPVLLSGRERLARDVLLHLPAFPVERVEQLLVAGLEDPRGPLRFGAMEAVRRLCRQDRLDPVRFGRLLTAAAERHPDEALLMVEAVAAIGRAEPELVALVERTPHAGLRGLAACAFALAAADGRARVRIESWIRAGGPLRSAGLAALGLLPGAHSDTLLTALYETAGSDAERTELLVAMTGRNGPFRRHALEALRSGGSVALRTQALRALMAGELTGAHDDGTAAQALREAAARDPDAGVRTLALKYAVLQDAPHARRFLHERFLAEPEPDVRVVAGAALLIGTPPGARAALLDELLASEDHLLARFQLAAIHDRVAGGLTDDLTDDLLRDQRLTRLAAEHVDERAAKHPLRLEAALQSRLLALLTPDTGDPSGG